MKASDDVEEFEDDEFWEDEDEDWDYEEDDDN